MIQTDEQGKILDKPPYPPFSVYLLGSDIYGYDLGHKMVEGAKWTIGVVLVVTFFRMLLSLIFSFCVYSLPSPIYKSMKMIFEPFSVVPQTIIAYFILYSVLWMPIDGFANPFWQRALFETLILVMIAIPNLTIHISEEIRMVVKEEFIEASKVLGSGKTHIFFKHIVPHVYEKWILLFGQQFIQALQLLAHLGFMLLFFGGTYVPYGAPKEEAPHSVSYEWSGVIGGDVSYLYSYSWVVLVPIGFFILTAISVALINDSVKAYFQTRNAIQFKSNGFREQAISEGMYRDPSPFSGPK
ncbi:ABC transporter permease subunit [Neobacillus dielmonensis]|uniref:ABC transporter permease subunit n=1 Tax=Neobacillus dielmonensis TaxID=1347369 RepID=UPI000AE8CF29|nr:ABC transporter permease subunit [Neobacillus dielmonensis]